MGILRLGQAPVAVHVHACGPTGVGSKREKVREGLRESLRKGAQRDERGVVVEPQDQQDIGRNIVDDLRNRRNLRIFPPQDVAQKKAGPTPFQVSVKDRKPYGVCRQGTCQQPGQKRNA